MPIIADYVVITDKKFSIATGGDIDRDFDFTLESGAKSRASSILALVLFVKSGANNLAFEVKINGSLQVDYFFNTTSTTINTLHEVISGNVLKTGTNNIEFRITGGLGTLEFGDVVLFYQRSI